MIIRAGLLTVLLSACGILPAAGRPIPPECEFPDDVALSFAGETTLAELGIVAPGREAASVYAWITAEPIHFPSTIGDHRAACAVTHNGEFERSVYPGSLILDAP